MIKRAVNLFKNVRKYSKANLNKYYKANLNK